MADGVDALRSAQGPECPQCRSAKTVRVDDRFGLLTFFCGDCQHSWEVLASQHRQGRPGGDPAA